MPRLGNKTTPTRPRFQRSLDLTEWLNLLIGQRIEQEFKQRLEEEREYWRCHVLDPIEAEGERLAVLVEEEHRKLIDCVKADHKVADLVEWNHEQSKRLIAEVTESFDWVFDRIQAKLDQFATLGMRRPDQSSPARNQGQGGAAGQSEAGICSPK
jgi:hypothetical protein